MERGEAEIGEVKRGEEGWGEVKYGVGSSARV